MRIGGVRQRSTPRMMSARWRDRGALGRRFGFGLVHFAPGVPTHSRVV